VEKSYPHSHEPQQQSHSMSGRRVEGPLISEIATGSIISVVSLPLEEVTMTIDIPQTISMHQSVQLCRMALTM